MKNRFKTKHLWLIRLNLILINIIVPIKLKLRGQHIIDNKSRITTEHLDGTGKWVVHKEFWTKEMIHDITNTQQFYPYE